MVRGEFEAGDEIAVFDWVDCEDGAQGVYTVVDDGVGEGALMMMMCRGCVGLALEAGRIALQHVLEDAGVLEIDGL